MATETTTPGAAYDIDDLLGVSVGDMTKNEPLPENVYHVRIAKATIKHPNEPYKKNPDGTPNLDEPNYPGVNWDYIVTGTSPEELHGRHIFEFGTLKPGATFVNRQNLETLGFAEDVTLRDALPELNTGNYEFLLAVTIQPEGKGKDGKWYDAKNKITRRLPLQS